MLIVIGGVQSATDLTHVRLKPLDTSAWAGKHVWEFHAYSFTLTFPDPASPCAVLQAEWGAFDGFVLEQGKGFTGPLFLSESGFDQAGGPNDGLSDAENSYLKCLASYMTGNDADWAVWALQGSYYARDNIVDNDESYGIMNHDWSGLRNPDFPKMLGGMWQVTQGP